ncbi:protein-glutamine gamma-glutamyltransferase 2-like [Megalops cyprinoides]|uniref:protein-glutamine gamma-glutamyltransferase 2-like n=1 Tax=Megalops cyprinoides TaxID=118141 RepID=UPI00186524CB|nr:protein-glutamine gamma-glutamyltransferase 2-like [Megalops cyprinoides]
MSPTHWSSSVEILHQQIEEVPRCRPAPVKAVPEANTDLECDAPFIYTKANADRVVMFKSLDPGMLVRMQVTFSPHRASPRPRLVIDFDCNLFPDLKTSCAVVTEVELHCVKNNTAHSTNDIREDRLIVRRGQSFLLTFHFSRRFSTTNDVLELTVETGPQASEAVGTKSVFKVPGERSTNSKKSWDAKIQETTPTSITLAITSPADASIGEYALSVKTDPCGTQGHSIGRFIVLFNPWCAEDWVYLPQQNEREEYIMNEQGLVYRGSSNCISALAWNFGQFEDDIVDICLKLLDVNPKCLRDAKEDYSARCNPMYVSRVVSAMINCNDDKGVLMGKWGNEAKDYIGGVPPTRWIGSVEILRRWFKYGCYPVKYGQCWVFAAVMCTVMRCLGIPCRVVTNFESAHDTDGSLTIDEFFSDYGVRPRESRDSVWNFHVWVEAWMKRPDLSRDAIYDGWQVLDPTPQELSEGVYCCGPAPVKAILEGHTDVKYDVPFVFAEVNADRVTWMVYADGSKRQMSSDTMSVGRGISTKSVGSDRRADITANYKYPEGTEKERGAFQTAVSRSKIIRYGQCRTPDPPIISMKIEELSKPINSKDIDLSLIVCSNHTDPCELLIHINAQAMHYTGVLASNIWNEEREVQLQPNNELKTLIQIPFSKYGQHMLGNHSIKVTAVGKDKQSSEAVYLAERNIVPASPPFKITTTGLPALYSDMVAEVVFKNPLPVALNDCSISLTGSGLLSRTVETSLASLGPGRQIRVQTPFKPYRVGPKKLVANFDCDLFRDIKTSCDVHIKHIPV